MKLKLFILALFSTFLMSAQSYKEKDKQLHFFGGMIVSGVTYELSSDLDSNNRFLWTVGSATAVGLGKEIYDSTQLNNKFDSMDLFYTSMGGVISYFLGELGVPGGVIGIGGLSGLYFRTNF